MGVYEVSESNVSVSVCVLQVAELERDITVVFVAQSGTADGKLNSRYYDNQFYSLSEDKNYSP